MSFIFGGNTGETYEGLQRRRKIAEAMMRQRGTPKTIGEGIDSFAGSIAGALMNKKLDKREKKMRDEANEMFGSLFGGSAAAPSYGPAIGGGASSPDIDTSSPDVIASDAMAAIGKGSSGPVSPDVIREGLIERGVPDHVADAFILNFKDESGLNPGINEAAPVVPGSRGGFGLAQWTGPRRKSLEQFAAQTGRPIDSVDTQLDFLMTELQGDESRAAQGILSAKDTPTAAAAIVNDFLRPAEEHRARRVAQYTGGQQTQVPGAGGGRRAGGGMGNPSTQQIVQALGNPIIQQDPGKVAVLNALLQRNMQAQDPMRQMDMQLKRAQLEAAQTPNLDVKKLSDGRFYYVDPTGQSAPRPVAEGIEPAPDLTSGQREYEMAKQQGYDGTFLDYKRDLAEAQRDQTNVNVNTGGGPELGKLSTDYGYVLDPNTGKPRIDPETGLPMAAAVPGSPAAREISSAEEAAKLKETTKAASTDLVMDEISMARGLIQDQSILNPTTGITGGLASMVDSTDAGALKNRLTTIKANIGFDKLQSMRDASPTGGALGQVSEFENRLLQAVYGSLEQSQRGDELLYNLDRLGNIYNRIIHEGIPEEEARQLYKQVVMDEPTGSNDLAPEQKGEMTFEQFSQDPSAQAAADQYGVTLEEMWDIKRGLQ